MLERLTTQAPASVLRTALEAPTDIGGMALMLSDLAPMGVEILSIDPLAEAMARGAAAKIALLSRTGGALTTPEVVKALGITRQAVDKRRTRRQLLAVPSGTGDYLYPKAQFTAAGPIPHLDQVLQAFRIMDPWTQLAVLTGPAESLDGRSAIEALLAGEIEDAVAVADGYGEQGR